MLDLAPVEPPDIRMEPLGERISFSDLVELAGMKLVISGPLPQVQVYDGNRDFIVRSSGSPIYCVASQTLPNTNSEKAREIIRRLAYGFQNWAAREVVARYHRDVRRASLQTAETVAIRLPEDILRALDRVADESGQSVSKIVERALREHLNIGR